MAGLARRRITPATPPIRRRAPESTAQAQKSAQTRLALMKATVQCITKFGYAHITTPLIAAQAGVSRGAMLHHFENGPALIAATIHYLHEKRLRAFQRAVVGVADPDDVRGLIQSYWAQLSQPTFIAFHELALAARTDPDLAKILHPAQNEFNAQWYRLAVELFPAWQRDRARFDLALALCRHTLEGLAVSQLLYGVPEAEIAQVLDQLERQVSQLHPPIDGV